MPRVSRGTKALAHLEMMRPYTMFHSGMVAIAGAEIASHGAAAPWRIALAAAVTMCGWEAGLYAGDYFDRDLDAQSKPYRAVPSGRVSPQEAFLTMIGLILAGYLCALILSPASLILAMLTTALGIAYSAAFKSRALLGNFDRGVLGVCAALFGALAGGASNWPEVILLCVMIFCHDSASNLVGAIRDLEGDRAAGYRTVPVVYGLGNAVRIAGTLAALAALAGLALLTTSPPSGLATVLFLGALALATRVYVPLWLGRASVTRARALAAHKYLVAERLVLLSAFIAVYSPIWLAPTLLATTLALTLLAQAALRDRYEGMGQGHVA